jgi:hypothetical protein
VTLMLDGMVRSGSVAPQATRRRTVPTSRGRRNR